MSDIILNNTKPFIGSTGKLLRTRLNLYPLRYGLLYNWYAATDARNIAPMGFHVPTFSDFRDLQNVLGNDNANGFMLQSVGTEFWMENDYGTDEYGFNWRGSGTRYASGGYGNIQTEGAIWCFEYDSSNGFALSLSGNPASLNQSGGTSEEVIQKKAGHSLRFIADSGTPTTAIGNDGKVYPCVTIGTQTWTAANSNETKYRNGDWVHGFDGGVYTPISDIDWAALTTPGLCAYNNDWSNV